jgi:hypothetical protein
MTTEPPEEAHSASDLDCYVRVTDDGLRVLLDCVVPERGLDRLIELIEEKLADLGLAGRVAHDQLKQGVRRAGLRDGEVRNLVILKGAPPVEPVDGSIHWLGPFFNKGFIEDPQTGAMNYRELAARRAVRAGQVIAKTAPPVAGKQGTDVFGNPIPVREGEEAHILAGKNVTHNPVKSTFTAVSDGRFRWEEPYVAVDEVYVIEGNVNLETTNIEHPGAVVVEGDVEPGARVRAEGDLDVYGMIESATVEAGGNVIVGRGIVGEGKCVIRAKGSVRALFAHGATVEAGGDIDIDRDVVLAQLRARGAVRVPEGRVLGGEVMALAGIEIHESGSEGMVPTSLVAGADFRLEQEIASIEISAEKVKKAILPLDQILVELSRRLDKLRPSEKTRLREVAAKEKELRSELKRLQDEMNRLEKKSRMNAMYRIVITKATHPETRLTLGSETRKVQQGWYEPIRAVRDKGRVRLEALPESSK